MCSGQRVENKAAKADLLGRIKGAAPAGADNMLGICGAQSQH